jgi:hypothetical protein
MRTEPYDKLELVVKVLIYYRNVIQSLIEKKASFSTAWREWLSTPRYYKELDEKDSFKITVNVSLFKLSQILEMVLRIANIRIFSKRRYTGNLHMVLNTFQWAKTTTAC